MQDAFPEPIRQSDAMDAARANACLAALGMPATIQAGDPLPPFFHYLHFWEARPPSELGRDGHPERGGIIPDLGLPRRMWAGGTLEFHASLKAGQTARKVTSVVSAEHKSGKSGPLGFVRLRHDIQQGDLLCVTEFQDLVYREDPVPGAPRRAAPMARTDAVSTRSREFDTTLLFRYSALTFNGHRIHYDQDYARNVEGYEGLVVHGPLLAQLLMFQATDALGQLNRFSFRATSPLMHFEKAEFCWHDSGEMWVRGPDGRLCMQATAA